MIVISRRVFEWMLSLWRLESIVRLAVWCDAATLEIRAMRGNLVE
jgi:hypothetical protein